jgi:2-(3-amino-3-carboxypropyl)histidine synthase
VEVKAKSAVESPVVSALTLLSDYGRIGLVTTVQHLQSLDMVRELLTNAGKTVMIGNSGRLIYAGQVIGCDFSNAKAISNYVDAFLFVGGGKFHSLGVALATGKPTFVADPYSGAAYSVSKEVKRIIKQRFASIEEARNAKILGVFVSLKPGQMHLHKALRIKDSAEKLGKSTYLFAVREITPEVLAEFPTVEAYVNTACPRISLDDASKFKKPILTVQEFKVVTGESSWESLLKNGLFVK